MTLSRETASGRAQAAGPIWRAELGDTVRLALPIALTQLGQVAMMTTDLALIGRLGEAEVAAAALAHIVLFVTFMVGMGVVSAVAPLTAQAYGAGDARLVRRALRVGLWAALMLAAPMTLLALHGDRILVALGQTPESARLAQRYLDGLAWTLIPGWWFIAVRSFMSSLNHPAPALWITLVAVPANFALAYALINGAYGFPPLDLLGAGLATTIVNVAMCLALLAVACRSPKFRDYRVLERIWRIDWPLLGRLFAIGLPIAGAFLLEYGLFAAAGLLMGRIGTTALAAHQIALTIASVLFMVPFGVSMAATVRVGHAVGRRDPVAARRAGFAAVALGATFMGAMTLVVVAFRDIMPAWFLGDAAAASETAALTAVLLTLGATFFIADGTQTVAAGALRGLSDTRVPLIFAAASFWLVGFTASYGLAFPGRMGAAGVWIGFTLGILVYAALLLWRFHLLTRVGALPVVAAGSRDAAIASE